MERNPWNQSHYGRVSLKLAPMSVEHVKLGKELTLFFFLCPRRPAFRSFPSLPSLPSCFSPSCKNDYFTEKPLEISQPYDCRISNCQQGVGVVNVQAG